MKGIIFHRYLLVPNKYCGNHQYKQKSQTYWRILAWSNVIRSDYGWSKHITAKSNQRVFAYFSWYETRQHHNFTFYILQDESLTSTISVEMFWHKAYEGLGWNFKFLKNSVIQMCHLFQVCNDPEFVGSNPARCLDYSSNFFCLSISQKPCQFSLVVLAFPLHHSNPKFESCQTN